VVPKVFFRPHALKIGQLAQIKSDWPYVYEALTQIVNAVNSVGRAAGVDPSGTIESTRAIGSLRVTSADGIFDLAITDNSSVHRGIFYFAESDVTPAFSQPRVHFLGSSRNLRVALGNQTLYWARVFAVSRLRSIRASHVWHAGNGSHRRGHGHRASVAGLRQEAALPQAPPADRASAGSRERLRSRHLAVEKEKASTQRTQRTTENHRERYPRPQRSSLMVFSVFLCALCVEIRSRAHNANAKCPISQRCIECTPRKASAYPLARPRKPALSIELVLEDDGEDLEPGREVADRNSPPESASRVTMAILQRLTAETYLLHDPRRRHAAAPLAKFPGSP